MSFKAHQTSRVSEQTRGASVRSPWDSLRSLRMFGYYKNQLTDQDHMRLSVSWGCFLCLPGLRQNLRQTSTEKKPMTEDRPVTQWFESHTFMRRLVVWISLWKTFFVFDWINQTKQQQKKLVLWMCQWLSGLNISIWHGQSCFESPLR